VPTNESAVGSANHDDATGLPHGSASIRTSMRKGTAMSDPRRPRVISAALQVQDGPKLAQYLRERGLSCRAAAGPGALVHWGVIYVTEPADLMRVRLLLEHSPRVVGIVEGRDRTEAGWPLWYRVARHGPPTMGTPASRKP
jgi:hypothetical protein